MALLVVLVVTMVSVVIISAASANAGRLKRSQNEEQAYLTVNSAAQLVRGNIEKVRYVTGVMVTTDTDGNQTVEVLAPELTPVDTFVPIVTLIGTATATVDFTVSADNMDTVQVKAKRSGDDISVWFWLSGGDTDPYGERLATNCCIRLDAVGESATSTSKSTVDGDTVVTTTTTLTWGEKITVTTANISNIPRAGA